MHHLFDIIMAKTPEERAAAEAALQKANAVVPSDWEVMAGFLKNCTTLDGKPLALDEQSQIVERND